jgi:hypothetical protein
MKKLVAFCLMFMMVIALAACSSKTESKKSDDITTEVAKEDISKETEADDISVDTDKTVSDDATGNKDNEENGAADISVETDKTASDDSTGSKENEETGAADIGIGTETTVTADTEISDDSEDKTGADSGNAEPADLYAEFKAGTAKVRFTGSGERSSYLDLSSCLEVGELYSVDELIAAIETVDPYLNTDLNGYITYQDIDCGSDGIPELLMMASFGDEFSINIVFKEIDGELRICYDQDSWSRCYTEVSDTGFITTSGSSGASVHDYEEAFIDADGNYVFLYGFTENMTLFGDFYAFNADNESVAIPTEGLDIEHICIMDYYFEPDYQDRTHYYYCIEIDDDFSEVEWDEDYKGDEELVNRFSEAGVDLYTKSEVLKMVEEKRAEYGLEFKYV